MRTIFLLALTVLLASCGDSTEDTATVAVDLPEEEELEIAEVRVEPSSSYDEAHAAAVAAIEIASKKGHAWNTSDQMIKDAADAAANGDEAHAISLADEARIHAELAAVQADREANSWRDNVITE